MNARLILAIALVFCAAVARGEEESSLAGVETVEPTFLEEGADAEGFPFQLSKKMQKTTIEPRYYGENNAKPKKYVSPEYQDPKPVDPKLKKKQPVVFTSHYFSPLPKNLKGLKASKDKKGRKAVPFRATVQTPTGLKIAQKGFTEAELFDGRLPNKFDDPRDKMKRTRAPAVLASFVEVDTTEAAEAQAVPPPFSQADLAEGEHAATIVAADQFFSEGFMAPTWKDEEAEDSENTESTGEVESDESNASVEDSVDSYEDLESFLEQAQANTASFVEIDETAAAEEEAEEEEESEDEEESEEEAEDEEESEEESEEEAEEESEEEAEEESEEEAEEEESESEPVSFVETYGDAEDAELDEMEVNERAAAQIDMDSVSDEAAMTDSDEGSSAEEADAESEEEVDENEALEAAENAEAAALVEEEAEGVDTLLAEVDSHLSSDSETEVEAATSKGTPGSAIAPGQTWEDAQNERLDALQSKLEAEKAATPKVQAQVVASKAELNAVDEEHQNPEYNSEAEQMETVEPEIMVEQTSSAQQVLLEKIAKLKAIRRA